MRTFQIKDVIHPGLNEHYYVYVVDGEEFIYDNEWEVLDAFLASIEDLFLMGWKVEVDTNGVKSPSG